MDQPTQVYFPNVTSDVDEEFVPKELVSKFKDEDEINDDIKSVERFFSEIIKFSSKTLSETGIEPQIIITDHADNLSLEEEDFNDYVRARWRKRGFINDLSS